MALPTYSKSVGTVFTLAARKHLSTIPQENFFYKCPTLQELRTNRHTEEGGDTLVITVINGAEPLGGSYSKTGTLTLTDSDVLTEAQYNWSFYYEPIVIYHQEMWKCRGSDTKIADFVRIKTDIARKKLERKIAQALFSSSQTAGVDLLGLPYAITTTPASDGVYGNLDGASTAQPWWRDVVNTGGSVSSGACQAALVDTFREIADKADTGRPTYACTDATTWRYLHQQLYGHFEIRSDSGSRSAMYGKLGFNAFDFMDIPIVSDPFMTAGGGVLYTFNHDAIELVEMTDCAFVLHPDGFVSDLPNRQMAWVSAVIWNGQVAVSERRALGKLVSIAS